MLVLFEELIVMSFDEVIFILSTFYLQFFAYSGYECYIRDTSDKDSFASIFIFRVDFHCYTALFVVL